MSVSGKTRQINACDDEHRGGFSGLWMMMKRHVHVSMHIHDIFTRFAHSSLLPSHIHSPIYLLIRTRRFFSS